MVFIKCTDRLQGSQRQLSSSLKVSTGINLSPGRKVEAGDFERVSPLTAEFVYEDCAERRRFQFHDSRPGGSKPRIKRHGSYEVSQPGSSRTAKPVAGKCDNCEADSAGDALMNPMAMDDCAHGLVLSRCIENNQGFSSDLDIGAVFNNV